MGWNSLEQQHSSSNAQADIERRLREVATDGGESTILYGDRLTGRTFQISSLECGNFHLVECAPDGDKWAAIRKSALHYPNDLLAHATESGLCLRSAQWLAVDGPQNGKPFVYGDLRTVLTAIDQGILSNQIIRGHGERRRTPRNSTATLRAAHAGTST